jgi:hypothetical protein
MNAAEMRLPLVFDTADLMAHLRVGRDGVHRLVATGELHRLAYSTKIILVSRAEVLAFLGRQTEARIAELGSPEQRGNP